MNGRAYKVMLYLGCVAGVYAGAAMAVDRGLDGSRFALVTIALLIPAFAGARAWFVIRHADAYRHQPARIMARSEGGAGLFGGLVVAILVSVPALHVAGLPFWTFWDAASITMLVGLVFTRFGCLMNGCCAGRPTDSPLGMMLTNAAGDRRHRYPTQLIEAASAGTLLFLAVALRDSAPTGALFAAIVVAYCALRVVVQPLRQSTHPPEKNPVGSRL